jgi:hypothetical protein
MALVLDISIEEDGKYVVHLGPRTLENLISRYKEGLNINEVLQSYYINITNPSFEKILKWDLDKGADEVSFFLSLLKRHSFDKEIGSKLVKELQEQTIRLSDIYMSFEPLMDDGSLKYDMVTGDKDGAESIATRFDKELDPHRRSIGNKVRPVIPGIQPTEDGDIKYKPYVELQDSWKAARREWPPWLQPIKWEGIPKLTESEKQLREPLKIMRSDLMKLKTKKAYQDMARKVRVYIETGAAEGRYVLGYSMDGGETRDYMKERFNLSESQLTSLTYKDFMWLCIIEGTEDLSLLKPNVICQRLLETLKMKDKLYRTYVPKEDSLGNQENASSFIATCNPVLDSIEGALPKSIKDLFTKGISIAGNPPKRVYLVGSSLEMDNLRQEIRDTSDCTWADIKLIIKTKAAETDQLVERDISTGRKEVLTAQIRRSLATEETRKAAAEKNRVNQMASRAGAKQEEGTCVICGKEGHWAVDKMGDKVTCLTHNDDAIKKNQGLKQKAEDALKHRKEAREKWDKINKKGRPGGG